MSTPDSALDSWPACIRLSPRYDVQRLRSDLRGILAACSPTELEHGYHDGSWAGIALVAAGGRADPNSFAFNTSDAAPGPTEVLARAPYLGEVLASIDAPKSTVRILRLSRGSRIHPHRDPPANFQTGLLRLHLPIVTHPDVTMILAGRPAHWGEGELWWGDFSRVHSVENNSPIDRMHLVMDCAITEALLSLFPEPFVAAQRRLGVTMHAEPCALPASALRQFECSFHVPRFTLPSAAMMSGTARLQLDGDVLRLYLDGEPRFALVPLSPFELGLRGWPTGMRLVFELEDQRVKSLTLEVRGMPRVSTFLPTNDPQLPLQRIPLRLL